MDALDEITATIESVASKVGPAVVGINRHGTGVVTADGFVVTNAHNLRGDETYVTFADGRTSVGRQAGVDLDGDIAAVAVNTSGASVVEFSTQPASLGQVVVALSNPRGRGLRATLGTVSSTGRGFRGPRGRRIAGSIEHTAPLARGSSGGPVLDREGRLLGINTNRLQEGFYQAIAATDDLRTRIGSLSRGEAPLRRRLGTAIAPPHMTNRLRAAAGLPEVDGLLVCGVEEESAADRAGLRRGDVLLRAGDVPLASVDALYEVLEGLGQTLELAVVRATEELSVTVTF
ncbi:MAG: S1C family serine protease [Acidimicrobiales bacterium]